MSTKESNPKDSVGVRKAPLSTVPAEVLMEIGVGMFEGARKYGRHNYRAVGVRASVYYDACLRHLMAWWEGEDIDPDSGLSHIVKLLTSAVVLRDAMLNDKLTDDRPPRLRDPDWMRKLNETAAAMIDRHPNAQEAYTEMNRQATPRSGMGHFRPNRTDSPTESDRSALEAGLAVQANS